MRLKSNWELMELDDCIYAVPTGAMPDDYHGAIRLNETGAWIFDQLKAETTEEALVEAMANEYDAPREQIASDVKKYIAEFTKRGLLV